MIPSLGFVGLISVVILLLFIPLESFVADKSRTNKKAVSKLSDSRMSLIYELIDGIKTLKLTGLRDIIQNRISKVRNDELSRAWKGRMLDASNLVISRFVPVIVIALTFGLYLISPESTLDAPTVFATLSLINIMARPINVIPKCISLLSGCLVSLKRIEDVLRLSEISDISELQSCQNNYTSTASVQLTNVTVVRQKTDGTCTTPLHNINCLLHGTRLVMVVGDNGSGKTTFLHAILKEAPLSPESHVTISEITNGRTNYNPRIAYVGHDAWILRDTVRKNIVIGDLDFISQGFVDESRYQHVIRLCCLDEDIQRWPNGDLTVVGEKGVTISGGQKARVSLARAIYSRAPILILDSPLAGLDKEVARQVFFEAIKKTAETRLVIMATHRLDLLSYSDYIIVLQNGSIIFDGTYQDMNISAATQNALVQIKNHHIESEVVGTTGNIAIERGRTGMISFFISIGNLKSQKAVPGEYEQLLVASGVDTGTSGETLWQLFLEYCRACGIFGSFLGILLSFTSYGLSAWSDWMLSYLADSPTRQAQNHFFQLFLFFSFLVLLNNISRYALMAYSGITGSKQLHNALTSSIISAPLLFFDAIPSGRIISRFSSDMDTIDNDIPSSLSSSYDAFLGVITGLLVVIIKSPIFLILVFPLGFQYQMIQKMYRKASVELKRLDSSSKSPVFSHFNETLAGLEYIRAYQLQSIMIRQHQDYLNRSISTRYNWDGVNRWLGIRLDLIGALIVSGAAYSLLFLETNSSNGGSAGLMVTYALKSTASLSFVVRSSTALENMMLSLSRVLEFIRIPSELESIPTSPSSSTKLYQNEDYHDDGDIESVPLIKQNQQNYLDKPIHLIGRDVTVSYHRTLPPVLKNVNFQLIGGKIIGLCGRTGGGKVNLFDSFYLFANEFFIEHFGKSYCTCDS